MNTSIVAGRQPWNKGKLVGQKAPLRLRDMWAIRIRLQLAEKDRDLALFDLAIVPSLKAPSDTWLLRLMMRWRWLNRQRSRETQRRPGSDRRYPTQTSQLLQVVIGQNQPVDGAIADE